MKKIVSNSDGFSMLEIVVAISISSIIMVMIYTSNRIILQSIKNFSNVSEFNRECNLAYYRLDRDITCAFYNPSNADLVFNGEFEEGRRSNSSLSFVSVDKSDFIMNDSPEKLAMDSDIKLLEYYLKKDPAFPDMNFLVRKEYILYNKVPGEFEEQEVKNYSQESILLKNVKDIKFEYFRGKWQDSWDSSTYKRLPDAVRTIIHINDYSGKEHTFSFISKTGFDI